MSTDTHVYHILTVTGFSQDSFDEAVKNAIDGGWRNHQEEFEAFVSFEVVKMDGSITMGDGGPVPTYAATVAISAIHSHHHEH
ncbi:MAG: dodecin domain-containing protein [Pseudomonadota bacterium]